MKRHSQPVLVPLAVTADAAANWRYLAISVLTAKPMCMLDQRTQVAMMAALMLATE